MTDTDRSVFTDATGTVQPPASTPDKPVLPEWEKLAKGGNLKTPHAVAILSLASSCDAAVARCAELERERGDEINRMADAIDAARYAHPEHPRDRPRPFAAADQGDREYAFRLARAAWKAIRAEAAEARLSEETGR